MNESLGQGTGSAFGSMSRRTLFKRGTAATVAIPSLGALLQACGGDDDSGGELAFWWWAEQDAPGANAFLDESVKAWVDQEGLKVDIAEQQSDTLISNFQSAATASSGPDLASQWATGFTLAQAWRGAIAPISGLVEKRERDHWLFRQENEYGGEQWAMPLYISAQPFVYNPKLFERAGLDPEAPPANWDQLIEVSRRLKAADITPLALGNKDTFGGRWLFAVLAVQQLDTLDELRQMVIGEASFADPRYTEWMRRLKELIDRGYFNDDVMSLDMPTGWDVFGSGKAAMAWTTQGALPGFVEKLGEDAVRMAPSPRFGSGELANAFTATQSTSFFVTDWAADKEAAADFLRFLHTEDRLNSWWDHTKILPADDRFDREKANAHSALSRQLVKLSSTGPQIWLQNWIPPELDNTANGPAGQELFTGGSVDKAAGIWERQAEVWRSQQPNALERWREWDLQPVVL